MNQYMKYRHTLYMLMGILALVYGCADLDVADSDGVYTCEECHNNSRVLRRIAPVEDPAENGGGGG